MNGHNFLFTRIIKTKWAPICIVWGYLLFREKAPNEVGLDIAGCITNITPSTTNNLTSEPH
jgi:hypothetical protein